jgi:hypothetical protein
MNDDDDLRELVRRSYGAISASPELRDRAFERLPLRRRWWRAAVPAGVFAIVAAFVAATISVGLGLQHHAPAKGTVPPPSSSTQPTPTVTQPTPSAPTAPPTPALQINSTITASPPLIVYPTVATPGQSVADLIARDYQGAGVGTFSLSNNFVTDWGYPQVSPDGSKLLLGNGEIVSVSGVELGNTAASGVQMAGFGTAVWDDDSSDLCGVTASGDLVEIDDTGAARAVMQLSSPNSSVLACSTAGDEVVVEEDQGTDQTPSATLVIQLSTGKLLASNPGVEGVVSHDCQLIAIDVADGVTIRNLLTWQVEGQVNREWPSPPAQETETVAKASTFSWDDTRLVLYAGGGVESYATYVVAWSTDSTIYQTTSLGENPASLLQAPAVIPLEGSSSLFMPELGGVYILAPSGSLEALPS